MIERADSALLTDLYMLTMMQGFFDHGMDEPATFEFFVRRLPPGRGFLIAAGLEQALDWLELVHFEAEELEWLAGTGRFTPAFLDHLAAWRFNGDVHAMPEGTVCFPDEPMLRVTAPIMQAQFAETRLVNLLHFQTLLASKAARCVLAAPGKLLVDFGLRRAHGSEAGLLAARASYLAGFGGTATVLAGMRFGVPLFGTMAHSFVQAHLREGDAFESFARSQPDNVVLLIDTYDTERGAREVVRLAPRLKELGIAIKGVRIDSGDLARMSRVVRGVLDEGGLGEIRIFCSGNLDEFALRALEEQGAPIDAFGVGTKLDTSADAPYLDCAYKLVEYAGLPRRKRSEGKATWPGRKQVHRRFEERSDRRTMEADTITVEGDEQPGEPLIIPVMKEGRRIAPPEPLTSVRDRSLQQVRWLPDHLRALSDSPAYTVRVAAALEALARRTNREPV